MKVATSRVPKMNVEQARKKSRFAYRGVHEAALNALSIRCEKAVYFIEKQPFLMFRK